MRAPQIFIQILISKKSRILMINHQISGVLLHQRQHFIIKKCLFLGVKVSKETNI